MEFVVFDSCLQRPKDVIFERLSEEGLVMEVENGEEEQRMQREVGEFVFKRENRMTQNENVCVCVCVLLLWP